jgi:hypothetical protein
MNPTDQSALIALSLDEHMMVICNCIRTQVLNVVLAQSKVDRCTCLFLRTEHGFVFHRNKPPVKHSRDQQALNA